jgi:hypothetical protein
MEISFGRLFATGFQGVLRVAGEIAAAVLRAARLRSLFLLATSTTTRLPGFGSPLGFIDEVSAALLRTVIF